MKNTFKYIAALVAFSAATLASGLSVFGQNLSDGTYEEKNGIAYAKRAILNNDGTYTIDLETFVTGEVTQTYESVPVDVVLVLDVSGSMDEEISTVSSYEEASVSSLSYGDYAGAYGTSTYQTDYYYYYNNDYRRVSVGRGGSAFNRHYYLSFSAGRTYYINSSGQVVTNQPSNVGGRYDNLLSSSVQLYEVVTTTTTKMDALKSAVGAFIDQIAHNDWYEDDTYTKKRTEALGNQISIVKFAMNQYYNSSVGPRSDDAPTAAGDHSYRYSSSVTNANYTEVVADFTATSDTLTTLTALKNSVSGLHAAGATAADYGMNLARILINGLGDDRANSAKTVVFFTDGAPTHSNSFESSVATVAIQNANDIKGITYGSGEDATHPTVFSVGVFKSGDQTTNVTNFMTNVATDSDHFMNASGGSAEDLKDIFTAIAHASGGSGNTEVSGESTLTVDIVSSSFSVPQGFEEHPENAVTVLVAPCNGITRIGEKDYLLFGEAKVPSFYGLDPIEPSISEDDNKVSTTGFDYSTNWCGPDPTSISAYHNYAYHGYKQIIRFTITVKDDAVGGPAVETNDPNSGIYLPGATEPLIKFNRPTVKLPVQIWIQKAGLQGEDSAVFTLARSPFVKDFDPATAEWENFTKIVVGPEDLDPETGLYLKKQVGLDPDYYYRIKEDAWAFGYTYQLGGVLYTVGDNVQNPFEFENTPKNKKFDEASARNVFAERKTPLNTGGNSGSGSDSGSN